MMEFQEAQLVEQTRQETLEHGENEMAQQGEKENEQLDVSLSQTTDMDEDLMQMTKTSHCQQVLMMKSLEIAQIKAMTDIQMQELQSDMEESISKHRNLRSQLKETKIMRSNHAKSQIEHNNIIKDYTARLASIKPIMCSLKELVHNTDRENSKEKSALDDNWKKFKLAEDMKQLNERLKSVTEMKRNIVAEQTAALDNKQAILDANNAKIVAMEPPVDKMKSIILDIKAETDAHQVDNETLKEEREGLMRSLEVLKEELMNWEVVVEEEGLDDKTEEQVSDELEVASATLKEIQEKHLEDSCLLKFEERTAAELVAMKLGTEQDCVEHEKHLLELKDNLLAKQKSHDKADAELKEKLEQITKDVLQKRVQVNRQKEQKKDLKMKLCALKAEQDTLCDQRYALVQELRSSEGTLVSLQIEKVAQERAMNELKNDVGNLLKERDKLETLITDLENQITAIKESGTSTVESLQKEIETTKSDQLNSLEKVSKDIEYWSATSGYLDNKAKQMHEEHLKLQDEVKQAHDKMIKLQTVREINEARILQINTGLNRLDQGAGKTAGSKRGPSSTFSASGKKVKFTGVELSDESLKEQLSKVKTMETLMEEVKEKAPLDNVSDTTPYN